jgi:predicted metal-dependent phosphoesterase TrpH
LAHPLKYKLTRTRLRRLLKSFVKRGGGGLEVISGQQQAFETRDMAMLANEFGLLASCGSDFHEPGKRWAELGRVTPLPEVCEPVWTRLFL